MSQPLFRTEVIDAKRASRLGGISLAQTPRLWLLTLGAAAAAAIVSLFVTLGTYTRRSTVTGQLVPTRGLAMVVAPATGVVARLDAKEGGQVDAGGALALVTVPRSTLGAGDTQVALEQQLRQRQDGLLSSQQAQQAQLHAQAQGVRSQWDVAQRELAQIESEIATRHDQIRIATETLDRLRRLEDGQYVSVLQIKQQEAAVLEYTGQMQALQRQAIGSRRSMAQLRQAMQELPAQRQAADAGYQRDLAQLQQERVQTQASGALVVNAPVSGLVATQMVKPGQAVQAGQPLMALLPGDGRLEAELLVPSRAIGFIEPGDRVRLRYQAFPYQKFGHQEGRVTAISRSALSPGELGALIGDAQRGEPFYRVTVSLAKQAITAYGKPEPLKPGMLVDADVLGEERTLIEWIFEPLYSIGGKVGAD